MKIILIYRKKQPQFNSIENVFDTLLPLFNTEIEKIELPYVSTGFLNRIKNILFIKKIKADIFHITGHDHYIVFGIKRNKTILTIHDINILNQKNGIKKYILKKIWFDWAIKKSGFITTISTFSKKEILKLNNYKTPIKIIPNPLTLSVKYNLKEFNKTLPKILHIGVKYNKNLNRLILALNGIKCQLIIIGKSNNFLVKQLNENKINYIFKKNISNNEIINAYKSCDIVSFVSTYEGFGLPIIEAQAVGRVVITSNISSMPEVAGKGAIFVNPLSVEDIKNGILELMNNGELREKLIQQGLKNVKRFTPQKVAQQYNNLYQEVIDAQ